MQAQDELRSDFRFTLVPYELIDDPQLSGTAKVVYVAIAMDTSKDRPWPGPELLMKRCGVNSQELGRAIRELENAGWIPASEGDL
jgi:hypothetical protein